MTDLQKFLDLYLAIGLAYNTGNGYFLPPGQFGVDNLQACLYVAFFTSEGNRVTHYFTPLGVYWTTLSGHPLPQP